MTIALSPIIGSRLAKAAADNGFDQELARDGQWLSFASTQCPLRIWLGTFSDALFLAAFSQQNVARALGDYGTPLVAPLPAGALGGRSVTEIHALHRLLARAFQLSKALPDELLHTFQKAIAALPRVTEIERLVVQRVGQDIFRAALLDYWQGRCALSGLGVKTLLRASHIKPWSDCATDAERLNAFNGILLAPHLDAVFDCGLMTLADDGAVIVSNAITPDDRHVLGLDVQMRARLEDGHRAYLHWHRTKVFRSDG